MTRKIEIRVTEAQYADLQNVARMEGRKPSAVIRDAVDEYVGDFRERKMFFVSKKSSYIPE